jgi:rRNA pseudouridine-1189 N-methylase Emg1 (Nep1/Mra1 family)
LSIGLVVIDMPFVVIQTYQILNCDDHANFLRKHKRDPALYRPDILHQVCLKGLIKFVSKNIYA